LGSAALDTLTRIDHRMRFFLCMTLFLLLLLLLPSPGLAQERVVIGPGDTVNLTVMDQAALTKRFPVSPQGTITLDLVGEVPVAGISPSELEADLRRRLAAFLVNPRVQVQIEAAQRVFVFGDVPTPGPVVLTANMTLLEALTRAGYKSVSEVVVVRPRSQGPAPIDAPGAQVVRVNLRELEKDIEAGRLERNLLLRGNDTIYVPADDPNRIHVTGAVRNPGPYSIPEGTTVLQALSLAGGATEDASVGRLRITRVVKGDLKSIGVAVDDAVEPGDTVIVPERLPLPAIETGMPRQDPANLPGTIWFGPSLSMRPVFAVKRIGIDSNVFNEAEASTDFVVEAGPRLETVFARERIKVDATGELDVVHYVKYTTERSVNSAARGGVEMTPADRLRFRISGSTTNTRQRLDYVLDKRVRRAERTFDGQVEFRPLRRLTLEFSTRDFDRVIPEAHNAFNESVALTERVRSVTAAVRLAVSPLTDLFISSSAATHRFKHLARKDSDATEVYVGGEFKDNALVSGTVRIGYLRHLGLTDVAPDLERVVGGANLYWDALEQTRLGVRLERTTGNAFLPEFSNDLVRRAGGSIRQGFLRRFDVLLEGYEEHHTYEHFLAPAGLRPPDREELIQRYVAEFGFRVQALRMGVGMQFDRRLSAVATRRYEGVRMLFSLSYGALQTRVI
jgi:polysaccharide export outer membrane protein